MTSHDQLELDFYLGIVASRVLGFEFCKGMDEGSIFSALKLQGERLICQKRSTPFADNPGCNSLAAIAQWLCDSNCHVTVQTPTKPPPDPRMIVMLETRPPCDSHVTHQAYEDSYEGDEPHSKEHSKAYVAMVGDELIDSHQLRRPEQLRINKYTGVPVMKIWYEHY